MTKRIPLIISIFAICFLIGIFSAACAPPELVEEDFFVDYDNVVKEVPFGTPLSLDGLIVKVKMTNGTYATLPRGGEGYSVIDGGYEKETPGTYTIVISYKDFPSVSFKITINEEEIIDENDDSNIVVTGIAVKQKVGKRLFLLGEQFSTEGIIVERLLSNNTSQQLTPQQYEINSESYKANESGSYEISVRYTDGQRTFTDTYTVVVTPEIETVLTKITLKTANVKKDYLFGEDFSSSGLVVEKWYSTDDVIVTEYATEEEYDIDSSAYIKTALGEYEIIISMKNAPSISASFEVTVSDYLHHISSTPSKVVYDLDEEFDPTGIVIYEYMASGDYTMAEPADYTVDSSEFDSTTVGTYTIRVYNTENDSLSAEFTVQVMDIPDL
jgi:hypothetical protein